MCLLVMSVAHCKRGLQSPFLGSPSDSSSAVKLVHPYQGQLTAFHFPAPSPTCTPRHLSWGSATSVTFSGCQTPFTRTFSFVTHPQSPNRGCKPARLSVQLCRFSLRKRSLEMPRPFLFTLASHLGMFGEEGWGRSKCHRVVA